MPKARKFAELEMPGTEEKIPQIEPVETDIREARNDRDLILPDIKAGIRTDTKKGQPPLPLA